MHSWSSMGLLARGQISNCILTVQLYGTKGCLWHALLASGNLKPACLVLLAQPPKRKSNAKAHSSASCASSLVRLSRKLKGHAAQLRVHA